MMVRRFLCAAVGKGGKKAGGKPSAPRRNKPSASSPASASARTVKEMIRKHNETRSDMLPAPRETMPSHKSVWSNMFGFTSTYDVMAQRALEDVIHQLDDPERRKMIDVKVRKVLMSDLDEKQRILVQKRTGMTDEQIEKQVKASKELYAKGKFNPVLSDAEDYERDPEEFKKKFRRRANIAIVGCPNGGKSTLLNVLIKNHVRFGGVVADLLRILCCVGCCCVAQSKYYKCCDYWGFY
jgi:hypothetical protein